MNRINIMPIAGLGKRFKDKKFKIPKPLIKIRATPMFIKSARSLPLADITYFIFMKKLYNDYKVKKIIDKYYNKKNFTYLINKKTLGQADTCYKLIKVLKKEDELFIASCDASYKFNKTKFNLLKKKNDMIIFTTNSTTYHHKNPKSFGWVAENKQGIKIKCKKIINKNFHKHKIIIGAFYFKNSFIYTKIFRILKKNNKKINNEFYIDQMFEIAQSLGYKLASIEVNNYKSFGTPDEL